jgi:tripartite-type tricarboxylate transporter receptor subunit TctC
LHSRFLKKVENEKIMTWNRNPLIGLGCAAIASGIAMPASAIAGDVLTPILPAPKNYPNKVIRLVEGFPPGGASDYVDRVIAQKLAERLGQSVIVDNRTGAGGNIGAEIAAKATPDGYTLFMATSAAAISPSLYPKLNYKVMRDFAYVTLVASGTYILVAYPSVPAKSVAELVSLAMSHPRQITYGSAGVGSPPHLAGEMLKIRTGVDMPHVPYKGAGPLSAAMVAGEVKVAFASPASVVTLIKAGRLNALAVTSANRAKAFPELPTIAESGYPGFDVTSFYGVVAPITTSIAIVKLLNTEIGKILQMPAVQAMFATQGLEATGSTPERFSQMMQTEIEKSAKVIKDANIKAE